MNVNFYKNEKYIFTINNTFHIIYFLSILKEYNLKNYIFVINNTKKFFSNGKLIEIFKEKKINFILVPGEDFFRKLPLSIIDIIKYKLILKNKFSNIRGYNLVFSQDITISNQLLLKYLSKSNKTYAIIDNSLYCEINNHKESFKIKLYKTYLRILGIKRGIKSGTDNRYRYKYYLYNSDINKNIIKKHSQYIKNVFNSIITHTNFKEDKYIIFLGQNIIKGYKIPEEKYFNKLNEIKKKYEKKGYTFLIKPHPLEDSKQYKNYKIIDSYIPAELFDIIFLEKDIIYVTFFSTVVLNLNFGKKFLIGDIGFGKKEQEIIKILNKGFNIPFLK